MARAQGELNPEALFFVLQMAKGYRFGRALTAGAEHLTEEDALGERLLEAIDEVAREAPPSDTDEAEGPSVRDYLLVASESAVGDDQKAAADRKTNLERAYDRHLLDRLLQGAGADAALVLFTTRQIQRALDQRTVMAYVFLGEDEIGRASVFVLFVSTERVHFIGTSH